MTTKRGRYMVSQKLSDYQMEKILRNFAHGIQAKDMLDEMAATGRPSRAANTVYHIYELTRKRLLEIGYFPEPADYAEWTHSTPELRANFPFSETARRIEEQADRLRGASDESVRYLMAEMIFRANNPRLNPDAICLEIRTALRMTGPLNRPPRDVDLWQERHYIDVCQRNIDELRWVARQPRKGDPERAIKIRRFIEEKHSVMIKNYEALILEAQKRLRKKLRERRKNAGEEEA